MCLMLYLKSYTQEKHIKIDEIPEQTLYTRIRREQLKIPKNKAGKIEWEECKSEIDDYKQIRFEVAYKKKLVETYMEAKGVNYNTAHRYISRQQKKGSNLDEIRLKLDG